MGNKSYLSAFKAKFSLLLETAKIKSATNSFFIISLHESENEENAHNRKQEKWKII